MVVRNVGDEPGVGEWRDGRPAGSFLVRDGGLDVESGFVLLVERHDGRAETGICDEEVLGAGDGREAEEDRRSGGGRLHILRCERALDDGECGEEAGVVDCRVAFDGGNERGFVEVEEGI